MAKDHCRAAASDGDLMSINGRQSALLRLKGGGCAGRLNTR